MQFNLEGKKINIADDVIEKYRNAVGFLPEMKTDEKWLQMIFCTAFDEPYESVIKDCPIPIIESRLSKAVDFEAEQYIALGGGIFK